jgi:hypothetical protein
LKSVKKSKKIRFNLPDLPNPFSHCIPKTFSVVYMNEDFLMFFGCATSESP